MCIYLTQFYMFISFQSLNLDATSWLIFHEVFFNMLMLLRD